ncbi:MAG TPA: class I SAM-dependent methyltransferase [Anaerolineales bacterium]|nr:class I SAM-dependent methyltransferase [Anaerolineales bacterium]
MHPHPDSQLIPRLEIAVQARNSLIEQHPNNAFRLFNGFYEGYPDLVVDQYASSLVLYSYLRDQQGSQAMLESVQSFFQGALPHINVILQKFRFAESQNLRRGVVSYGSILPDWIEEFHVKYAIDLRLNQDASFYLDTRQLRKWLLEYSRDKRVLNLFAYTGSLGIAALAGAAQQVDQADLKQKFLQLALHSVSLNNFELSRMSLHVADFFTQVAYYKQQGTLFNTVILDAPFFSITKKGSVDLARQTVRLVNKVRPLVSDGGHLVVVNNALFLSGKDFLDSIQALCQDGYLKIEQIVPAPEDITGYPQTIVQGPPVDPSPFNHPTKILVLSVKRK